ALSSENILRPEKEINFLKRIFYSNLSEKLQELNSNNIKINFIGALDFFGQEMQNKMHEAMQLTKNNTGLVFTIALNYGGRWDIVQACNKILNDKTINGVIDEELFAKNLTTHDLPDPDLLIR